MAAQPPSTKPAVQKPFQSIKIFPSEIVLGSRRSSQRIVVQGFYADGYSEDLTAKAKVAVGDPKIARRRFRCHYAAGQWLNGRHCDTR